MKKFRLFLLTWIVSILSIGCFTNANVFWDQKNVYSYQNLVQTYINSTNLYCEWVWKVTINHWALNPSNWQYEYRTAVKTCPFSVTNDDIEWFRVGWLDDHPVLYSYVPSTPNSQMQPAINWLHDTVREIIPYIVYIWIWVLLAILWFYAVRWLVNRIARKINSVFRSKRS